MKLNKRFTILHCEATEVIYKDEGVFLNHADNVNSPDRSRRRCGTADNVWDVGSGAAPAAGAGPTRICPRRSARRAIRPPTQSPQMLLQRGVKNNLIMAYYS